MWLSVTLMTFLSTFRITSTTVWTHSFSPRTSSSSCSWHQLEITLSNRQVATMNKLVTDANLLDNRLLSTNEDEYERLALQTTETFRRANDLVNVSLDVSWDRSLSICILTLSELWPLIPDHTLPLHPQRPNRCVIEYRQDCREASSPISITRRSSMAQHYKTITTIRSYSSSICGCLVHKNHRYCSKRWWTDA